MLDISKFVVECGSKKLDSGDIVSHFKVEGEINADQLVAAYEQFVPKVQALAGLLVGAILTIKQTVKQLEPVKTVPDATTKPDANAAGGDTSPPNNGSEVTG